MEASAVTVRNATTGETAAGREMSAACIVGAAAEVASCGATSVTSTADMTARGMTCASTAMSGFGQRGRYRQH
jgi:hypothetical protein